MFDGRAARVDEFEALTVRWRAAVDQAEMDEARRLGDEAVSLAAEIGDPALRRRAECNRAQILIELGEGDSVVASLRQVLTESREPETSFWTAYGLARAYDIKHETRKATFYVRLAKHHLSAVTNRQAHFAAHNQAGCMLLGDSRFEDASAEFETALSVGSSTFWEAFAQDNLGYCYVVMGRFAEGMSYLYRSLRTLRHAGHSYVRYPHLALSLAHLDLARPASAARHGRKALDLSNEAGDGESAKMALYLLGETAKHTGNYALARSYFDSLQARFYPENPRLPDALLTVDTRQMVNLKAQV